MFKKKKNLYGYYHRKEDNNFIYYKYMGFGGSSYCQSKRNLNNVWRLPPRTNLKHHPDWEKSSLKDLNLTLNMSRARYKKDNSLWNRFKNWLDELCDNDQDK